jgi:hypothetical protein
MPQQEKSSFRLGCPKAHPVRQFPNVRQWGIEVAVVAADRWEDKTMLHR